MPLRPSVVRPRQRNQVQQLRHELRGGQVVHTGERGKPGAFLLKFAHIRSFPPKKWNIYYYFSDAAVARGVPEQDGGGVRDHIGKTTIKPLTMKTRMVFLGEKRDAIRIDMSFLCKIPGAENQKQEEVALEEGLCFF